MRHSMMNLEFRQRPRSVYGKNGSTPATQFAMIMLLHANLDTVDTGSLHTVLPNSVQR